MKTLFALLVLTAAPLRAEIAWDSFHAAPLAGLPALSGPAAPLPQAPAPQRARAPRPPAKAAVNDPFAPFSLPDIPGKPVVFNYSDPASPVYGKKTVMIFFASWCPYSQKELPYFQKLYKKYAGRQDVQFLGVRTRRAKEKEDIKAFIKRFGLEFLIVSDTPKEAPVENEVYKLYGITGVPTVLIYDKAGALRHLPAEPDNYADYVERLSGVIESL